MSSATLDALGATCHTEKVNKIRWATGSMLASDASKIAGLITRLRLVDEIRLAECVEELDPGQQSPENLLRILERKGLLTPWQSSKLLKGDRDGFFLGGYRILYRIAAGSFGRVFRADDPNTGTIVAVKVLRRKFSEDRHMVDLFHREGKVGQTLHHPNIVTILAVGKDQATGQHFIVMEFVEGGNLRDILKIRSKMMPLEAVKIVEECAAGLACAHARGLTHRDMKPTNILISSQGVAKLVDFGLAEIAGGAAESDPEVDRTVDYAGLEKATGVKAGDVRSDIFFLGCIFYEMLTGRPPLTPTRDKNARMNRGRFEMMPTLSPGEVAAPPSLFKLLERMMAFQPQDRYQTPAQLHEAVRRVQNELEGHATDVLAPSGPRTVFVVEGAEKLQDALRDKLKALDYRVLISHDPGRAEQRYRDQPYHAIIIDAGTAGEDGLAALKRIIRMSDDNGLSLAALILLSEEQADWAQELPNHRGLGVLVRPISLRQLYTKLKELDTEPVAS
jgi:eukaryotic-like serine/threonine-protein kinase